MHNIYFDNAATTALDQRVLEVMLPFLKEEYGNPSSIHGPGRSARLAIEESRKKVAQLLGAKPAEIFFTSCGTESTNTVLQAAVRSHGCEYLITSPIEHHATLLTAERLCQEFNVQLLLCKHLPNGEIDYKHLQELIKLSAAKGKTFVSIMHANNEIGIINDIEKIGSICAENDVLFHSDMVQTIGHFDIDLSKLPVHFVSASAHKFHGPKGKGMLYLKSGTALEPLIIGGGQERNLRAGTEDVAGIVGFTTALELALADQEKENSHTLALKSYCLEKLVQQFEGVKESSDAERKLPRVLSVLFPFSPKAEMLQMTLDMKGIAVSGGSACSSGAAAGSHVINYMNPEACVPLRISFSKWNTQQEVDTLLAVLKEFLA